jgi:pilus assembly protein Flp/PilA
MFDKLIVRLHSRLSTRGEEGATAAEYGLLISLIALAIIGGAEALGLSIGGLFEDVAAAL